MGDPSSPVYETGDASGDELTTARAEWDSLDMEEYTLTQCLEPSARGDGSFHMKNPRNGGTKVLVGRVGAQRSIKETRCGKG
jgi:hypothetical protein